MEKVAKFLGVDKDIRDVVKNVILLLVTTASFAFAAGTYFGTAKDIPSRLACVENKQTDSDRKQDRMAIQLETITSTQIQMASDIRELRSVLMDRRH